MSDYGTDGTVSWVFRQYPIVQLHPNAPAISAASECVAELGGNEAFWKFTDTIFANRNYVTAENGQQTIEFTKMENLGDYAAQAGVDKNQYELCANSGKYNEAIVTAVADANAAGAEGTPYTAVLVGNEFIGAIPGALPYADVKQSIDNLLAQLSKKPSDNAPAE